MTPAEIRTEVITDLGRFTHDPLGFVLWAFPWGVEGTSLANEDGPDDWQRQHLLGIGEALRSNPHQPFKDSTASAHGIGKSTSVAWLILWSLMTHEDARGVVTANTENQLRTKTWPEVSKWFSLLQFDCLRQMFVLEATSLHSTQSGHERTWRFDAIPWSQGNPEAFAGLHNAGKRIVLLFDEASTIADAIWDTAEGALTTWQFHGAWMQETRFWTYREVNKDNTTFLERYLERDYNPRDYVKAEIIFLNGVVKQWKTLPRPLN